jgi:NAD(P)-dependent dehydrogenase (short-subunit alcohol dehydrogenase family)
MAWLDWTSERPFNIVCVAVRESAQRLKSLHQRLFEFRKAASAEINDREQRMGRLEGKSVIITGAGSGIGRAASLLFAREGARLIAVDRAEGVKETVEQVRKAGGTAEAVMADAGSEKDVMAFIAKAVSAYGRLDAIWANAGISGGLVPLAEQTVEQWQEILRINLIGPFLAIKHSIPHMIQQKYGAIVCTASVAGLKSGASGHPYAASKAGVISLVQTTAYSLSGTGVRINAVCPGLIETGMTKPIFDNARQRGTDGKIGQLNPLKRAGQPHELAAMGLFLASDDASYVNGQAIPVDGGLTASMPYAGKPV